MSYSRSPIFSSFGKDNREHEKKLKDEITEQHKDSQKEAVNIQYEKLAEDWRQINTILWGIPSVAVAIITGVIVGAYQHGLEGWPRIIALSVGRLR